MIDLMDDLLLEFNSMTLESEKKKVNTFIKNANKKELDEYDINSLILEFSQLDVAHVPHIIDKFYTFILKRINRDRKYISSQLFVPPEPPMCR